MVRALPLLALALAVGIAGDAAAQTRVAPRAAAPAAPVPAADVMKLSLAAALEMAARDNPTLRAKSYELSATRANETTAALSPNPFFSYGRGGFNTPRISDNASIGTTVELGDKRERRVDSARAATRQTAFELEDVKRQVMFQVKAAYAGVLQAKAVQIFTQTNLVALDEVTRLQQARFSRGDLSGLELNRIRADRFQSESDAADAVLGVKNALITLRSLVSPDRIPEQFDVIGELTYHGVQVDKKKLYEIAVQNRPDLMALEAAKLKAEADIRLARANSQFDLSPVANWNRDSNGTQTWGLGINIPLQLFDRNQGEIARTRADAERVYANLQAAAIQVQDDLDGALAQLENAERKVSLLRDTYLPLATETRDQVRAAYLRGAQSLLEFLDAERVYRQTTINYINALAAYETAIYQLEAAVGGQVPGVSR
ncbi:MAG: TolC family protein [Alphaproteobacteria bacterium]|nr:TolC family protein [Alphaproteobacteria bacterium]